MPLMRVSKYREHKFAPDSRPSITTIKKWIQNGDIAGEIIGGNYFVNTDNVVPTNSLVNKVLNS